MEAGLHRPNIEIVVRGRGSTQRRGSSCGIAVNGQGEEDLSEGSAQVSGLGREEG